MRAAPISAPPGSPPRADGEPAGAEQPDEKQGTERPSAPGAAIRFAASDGRELGGCWWAGSDRGLPAVVCAPAIGARQGYLRWFAGHLGRRGWAVLTFDYRGVGASADPPADRSVSLDDWAGRDLPAAVAEASRRTAGRRPIVFAHSLGGQLLGQSPARTEVQGAVLLASQRGIPRLFRGRARLRIECAYLIFPFLVRLLGRLPASRYTLPEPCPGPAIAQWVRWGRQGLFTDTAGRSVESRFAEYRAPLVAVTIDDDVDYAPPAAVEALVGLYSNAAVRRERLSPRDWGLPGIGHFGFFRRGVSPGLWAHVEGLLRGLVGGAADLPLAQGRC